MGIDKGLTIKLSSKQRILKRIKITDEKSLAKKTVDYELYISSSSGDDLECEEELESTPLEVPQKSKRA